MQSTKFIAMKHVAESNITNLNLSSQNNLSLLDLLHHPLQRWAESHFSDSDSAPAPCFKTPAPKNFKTSTPTPVNTPKTSK